MNNNNPHSPSQIEPADYEYVFSYCYFLRFAGMTFPGVNIDLIEKLQRSGELYSQRRNCHSCGATFNEGCAFKHTPTGKIILVGHICAEKMRLRIDEGDYQRMKLDARLKRNRLKVVTQRKRKMTEFLRGYSGDRKILSKALKQTDYFVRSIRMGLIQHGKLSDRQIEAVLDSFNRKKNVPAAVFEEKGAEIVGTVLSARYYDSMYGYTPKMLIRVEGRDGVSAMRLFGTVPSGLLRGDSTDVQDIVGKKITMFADVKPKPGEEGFGFFSRPRKAKILNSPEI